MLDVILLDLPRSSLRVVLYYAEGAVRGMELVDLGLETGECGVSGLIEHGWPALVLSGFTDTLHRDISLLARECSLRLVDGRKAWGGLPVNSLWSISLSLMPYGLPT
jgi:hypothetical protein